MAKLVYAFGSGKADGDATMSDLLGRKGANLAEMSRLGIPVPPGFTLTTELYAHYRDGGDTQLSSVRDQVSSAMEQVGRQVGFGFGDEENPLLVSVRSGARVSMPGMMETVLNLGLNDATVEGFARKIGDRRCAFDSYRRFIQMYSSVVLGIDHGRFESILDFYKQAEGISSDIDMQAEDWEEMVRRFKVCVMDCLGVSFPQNVDCQLWDAVRAVFASWRSERAITYRTLMGISDDWGTAVNVQAMVFGNMGDDSATGVAFTRNPSTGEDRFYGEFLVNAQGEDVVAGIRIPKNISKDEQMKSVTSSSLSLEEMMPEAFEELVNTCRILERHYRDMQDVEFTIQQGRLWILQARSGKRTVQAAVRIAVDMAEEGLISREDAVLRIAPEDLSQLLHPTLSVDAQRHVLARGLPASPGAAVGEVVFHADDAKSLKEQGRPAILVRMETSPDDIHGMYAAEGVLTACGGMTSHAAVVARGMGRPCVSGASAIKVDYRARLMTIGGVTISQGEMITIDGATGEILQGALEMCPPKWSADFGTLMSWADGMRVLGVRANADTPQDVRIASEFGAEGIGLCRTEHMFFAEDRILVMRAMILALDDDRKYKALDKIFEFQCGDFESIFDAMPDSPVTIRLLDPPLHEFLPSGEEEIALVAEQLGYDRNVLAARVRELSECNPMLGHRGCRLGVTDPRIVEVQARAILIAAARVMQRKGAAIEPEIMVPFIWGRAEFDFIAESIRHVAEQVQKDVQMEVRYKIGAMIELPRACLRAGDIAVSAEFFSFGTNDLTQTCVGISRDDFGRFLPSYVAKGILKADPFASIDQEGVGELMRIAVERGRNERPDLKIGICGEHGGDPVSVDFCHRIGVDYVSCSPFRLPIARLAAAQAAAKAQRFNEK